MARRPTIDEIVELPPGGRISKIVVSNYRSIASASLELSEFTVLVGRNGAGKSNVVDVFRFVAESFSLGLYAAIERRGGIQAVRHRAVATGGNPRAVEIGIEIALARGYHASYNFRIASKRDGYRVSEERLRIWTDEGYCFLDLLFKGGAVRRASFNVDPDERRIDPSFYMSYALRRDEFGSDVLALPLVGNMPGTSIVIAALRGMRVYSIAPEAIRDPQDPDEGTVLRADGRNASSVWRALDPGQQTEIVEHLAQSVPGITGIRSRRYGKKIGLLFQESSGGGRGLFEAHQMSDGTLRLFGILLAVLQPRPVSVLVIEEPEASIHLGALAGLVSVAQARSETGQVVFTTHSSDLIDVVDTNALRLVSAAGRGTVVAPPAAHAKQAIKDALFTPGELFRAGGLVGEGEPVSDPVGD